MAAHSIFLRRFVDEIVRRSGRTREDVEGELLAAARRAAREHFGEETPLEVSLSPDIGEVRLAQRLKVVDAVHDPKRQVNVLALRRLGADAAVGDDVEIPIHYTAGNQKARKELEAWKDVAPLPVHDERFWDTLNAHLNEAVQRHFPPRTHAPGTLGHLLASGGDWARGVTGRAGGTEAVLESAFVRVTSLSPTHEWVDYGFTVRVQAEARAATVTLARGDNEGNVRSWMELPTADSSRAHLEAALAAIAAEVERERAKPPSDDLPATWREELRFLNGHTWTPELLLALLRRPAPGSLMSWLKDALPRALGAHTCRVPVAGGAVTFRVTQVHPPDIGLSEFGSAALRLVAELEGAEQPEYFLDPERGGDVLPLGSLERASLDLPAPANSDEIRDVEGIVATFREWLDASLRHHASLNGLPGFVETSFLYAFPGYFPLVQLIEQRLELGPPGPPPVPPFDDEALALAARTLLPVLGKGRAELLRAVFPPRAGAPAAGTAALETAGWEVQGGSGEGNATTFAVFAAQGWRILLRDDLGREPFGLPEILLLPPEGGDPVTVMMVDAWNPQARTVVDGDAFAFRRFLTWLRQGILRGGHDATIVFEVEDDDAFEEEAEADEPVDEGDEDGGAGGAPSVVELRVSDWLLFDLPDFGDRFLVDWRAQWHVVNAVGKVEDFAGIYGFTAEYLERLRTHDVPLWRRFLREVIDPRFDETTGARLAVGSVG